MNESSSWIAIIVGLGMYFITRELDRQDSVGKERHEAALNQVRVVNEQNAAFRDENKALRQEIEKLRDLIYNQLATKPK